MSKFNFAKIACTAVLATGMVAGADAAFAHGLGGHMGGTIGLLPHNVSPFTNVNRLVDHDRRRFRFFDIGYAAPSFGCFYKRTVWGLVKICPDLD